MLASLLVQLAAKNLDAVLDDPALRGAVLGVCVLDSSGKELYSRNPDLRLIPASNQKLITGAYALHELGPSYQPTTRFWKTKDAVIVDSTGDPLLSHGDLIAIKGQLKIGRKRPVWIHSAYGPLIPPGWEQDDLRNKYAAPVSAFSVDRSSFELWSENGRLFYLPE